MYNDKTISVVVPCYNEESQIGSVLEGIPEFVDKIIVVDDFSSDGTKSVVTDQQGSDERIELISHNENQGVGGALASGYLRSIENNSDVTVVMDGDGQMDPSDLPALIQPLVDNEADYAKGNRLFFENTYEVMPKIRFFGNHLLTLLTKIASGYWHITDSQCGYTAINNDALTRIDWSKFYKDYGQPNDLLVKLNVHDFRVIGVPVKPVYRVGENSGIKLRSAIPRISWLLLKLFLWRLKQKYFIQDFHPLIFFYFFGFFFGIISAILFARLFFIWLVLGELIPKVNALAGFFFFNNSVLFLLFAMWFDMDMNRQNRNQR